MSNIKELSLNNDFAYKCDECDTMISKPGLCRECKDKRKRNIG